MHSLVCPFCNDKVAPPTAASIVANGVNGKTPEPEPVAEETPAPAEDAPEAKEDGEGEVSFFCLHVLRIFVFYSLLCDFILRVFFLVCLRASSKYFIVHICVYTHIYSMLWQAALLTSVGSGQT